MRVRVPRLMEGLRDTADTEDAAVSSGEGVTDANALALQPAPVAYLPVSSSSGSAPTCSLVSASTPVRARTQVIGVKVQLCVNVGKLRCTAGLQVQGCTWRDCASPRSCRCSAQRRRMLPSTHALPGRPCVRQEHTLPVTTQDSIGSVQRLVFTMRAAQASAAAPLHWTPSIGSSTTTPGYSALYP